MSRQRTVVRLRLTKAQWEELGRMVREPQPTWGKHRVRVQNGLIMKGLGVYTNDEGTVVPLYEWKGLAMVLNVDATRCAATAAGKRLIETRRSA